LSEQDYSLDDRALLTQLAVQAAPAVRVAQMVQQQQAESIRRDRLEYELGLARRIQYSLLPEALPRVTGWHLATHYEPASAVGGDFFDFIHLADGRLGLVIGDVADKGIPAALVMAVTRGLLRAVAQETSAPGEVLARVNNMLEPDIPTGMFVTCLYGVLDPESGLIRYANAGHNPPFRRQDGRASELKAKGMPLGLMPDMEYEEKETTILTGEYLVLYSDGLVEAHAPDGDMYGYQRLRTRLSEPQDNSSALIEQLLAELAAFTGPDWQQEDDITIVTLQRMSQVPQMAVIQPEEAYS
jgi:serine phosphatase RsbU (regulator of sigma subunit)